MRGTLTTYAQIEKELLAIIWSCHKFDQYIYGRDVVHIDSDHELLQAVFKKPIPQSPKCLQRMRMALQNHSLDIRYERGCLMFTADALSRSYRLTTDDAQQDSSKVCTLREVHHKDGLSVSPKQLEEFKLCTAQDPEIQLLTSQIQKGWPSSHKECPSPLIPYHESRSELIEENGLVFRGTCLVVPPSLRTDMLKEIHHSHIGTKGCLRKLILVWSFTLTGLF